ncbi:SDR family NAD(P)-dependent oxidoreductase [Mycolicibacterium neoaurum]|uniref:SDR family NAD(P)-dependent oxidoreductase n=1 Tax=Mycolicibacterium neoaurum TaxID=1795 RepID=UPI00248C9AFA|nr:SDR family oxidoreductase [Mycolicibacterium neoaurum]WBP96542.1 SDR family NAD(P)-dependent oxidoreductase [Mycolicibacterium neoaurum]WBS09926.1 SDR family NAD(P)-dependent oxidoreductase [Mycolicibacterium neoaurum]
MSVCRALVTGAETDLGAAVRAHLDNSGARTVGAHSRPCTTTDPVVHADPADARQVRAAVRQATDVMGGLDVLVVAHPLPVVAPLQEQSMAEFWSHIDTTLSGSFYYAQAAAEVMRDAGTGGRIVLTTSKWHVGGRNLSAVATAAGGIVALTKTLTRDFGRFRVGVNAVAVGAVNSEWSVCDAATDAPMPPGGACGSVDQVARVIALLCRHRLGAAVGQIVNVDGGLSRNRV